MTDAPDDDTDDGPDAARESGADPVDDSGTDGRDEPADGAQGGGVSNDGTSDDGRPASGPDGGGAQTDDRERPADANPGNDDPDGTTDDDPGDGDPGGGGPGRPGGGSDPERVEALAEELQATREDLAELESRVEDRTVHRDDIRAELRRYVRARQRRGHATGWGPYLVLLYGTAMSLGAFYYLGGPWVIASLIVVWLSTLGLFVVMMITGALIGAGRKLGGVRDLVGKLRR